MAGVLTIAVIAGEVSGDLLGGDLIAALKRRYAGEIRLVGVGGEALAAEGLVSLFDYSELSVMGLTQVLAGLPKFIRLIGLASREIAAARPDLLLIIDSPDFTHRVAKKVRAALPDLPVIDYVCPSVWAWKEYRATAMLSYVDRVLAVLPFEPAAMARLGGPRTDFVGHRLTADADVIATRAARAARFAAEGAETAGEGAKPRSLLLLPGSRKAEITGLMPLFRSAAEEFVARNGATRFVIPTVPRQEARVRALVEDWTIRPEIVTGREKWRAFAEADAALAASGTVILELALCGVPAVSTYKADWLIRMMAHRIKVWTGALPNLIADYVIVPEYLNEVIRPSALVRWLERLSTDTIERRAMLEGYAETWRRLSTAVAPGDAGAAIVLDLLAARGRLKDGAADA